MNYFHVRELSFTTVPFPFLACLFWNNNLWNCFTDKGYRRMILWSSSSIFSHTVANLSFQLFLFWFFFLKAEKKGASNTVIGMIFGCYALFDFLASLVFGKYVSINFFNGVMNYSNYKSKISTDAEITSILCYELCFSWQFHSYGWLIFNFFHVCKNACCHSTKELRFVNCIYIPQIFCFLLQWTCLCHYRLVAVINLPLFFDIYYSLYRLEQNLCL